MKKSIDILLVEDDAWLGEQFARVLQSHAYTVRHAINGQVAMDMINEVVPDVLIVDILLTGGTIMTLLHELQSYHDTATVPVILCSNLAGQIELSDVKPYGVRRILDKTTMLPEDLVAAVRSVTL